MGIYLHVNFKDETDEAKFFGVSVEILRAAKKRIEIWEEECGKIHTAAFKSGRWDLLDAHHEKLEGFDKHLCFFDLGKLRTMPSCSQKDWGGCTSNRVEMERILGDHMFNCSNQEDAYHAYCNIHLISSISWC